MRLRPGMLRTILGLVAFSGAVVVLRCGMPVVKAAVVPARSVAVSRPEAEDAESRAHAFIFTDKKRDSWEPAPGKSRDGQATWLATALVADFGFVDGASNYDARVMAAEVTDAQALAAVARVASVMRFKEPYRSANKRVANVAGTLIDQDNVVDGYYAAEACNLTAPVHDAVELQAFVKANLRWRSLQRADGSWADRSRPGDASGTFIATAAAVAGLCEVRDATRLLPGAPCVAHYQDSAIEPALKWLGDHVGREFEQKNYHSLYLAQRVCMLTGRSRLGTQEISRKLASKLIEWQNQDGSWGSDDGDHVVSTALAFLTLDESIWRVDVSKLQYTVDINGKSVEAHWNESPLDIDHLTRWMIHEECGDGRCWQIVEMSQPVEELLDAPVLYISGNQVLHFSDSEMDKLHAYVNRGGMILGNADKGSAAFAASFQKVGSMLFPDFQFRNLRKADRDHPIFTEQIYKNEPWVDKTTILAMSNGKREVMLLLPDDLARAWQVRDPNGSKNPFECGSSLMHYNRGSDRLRTRTDFFWSERKTNRGAN